MKPDGQLILRDGTAVPYFIKISKRAVRMRLTIQQDGTLVLTVPERPSPSREMIEKFLITSQHWVARTRKKLQGRLHDSALQHSSLYPTVFAFPVTGETLPIRYQWEDVCWAGCRENGDHLLVTGAVLDPELVRDVLEKYLVRKAEFVFAPLLSELAMECGLPYQKMSCRVQKGHWGSCSGRKNISLNAKLLFCPPEEIRYVMIHELCHTQEMNHSVRFWKLVEKFCPDAALLRERINARVLPV